MSEKIKAVQWIDLSILKTHPPTLWIHAKGILKNSGWTNPRLDPFVYVKPPADGIYEFNFVADPPSGPAADVLTPTEADYLWHDYPRSLEGVKIYAEDNNPSRVLPARPAKAKAKNLSQDGLWNAWVNNMPLGMPVLHVTGAADSHPSMKVDLLKACPQGINPAILLLQLVELPSPLPTKQPQDVHYYEHLELTKRYQQVDILDTNGNVIKSITDIPEIF